MNSKPASQPMRIILVENHRLMAEGVEAILGNAGIVITGVFSSGQQVLKALQAGMTADLIICDLWLEDGQNGVQLLTQLQADGFAIPMLILSVDETPDSIRMALQAGARGYLPKDCLSPELLKAIYRIVQDDEVYLSPRLLTILVSKTGSLKSPATDLPVLTKQELKILTLVANEYENQEIAEKLFISVGTVETHRKNLMKKLNVKNAIALANVANRYGFTVDPLPDRPGQW